MKLPLLLALGICLGVACAPAPASFSHEQAPAATGTAAPLGPAPTAPPGSTAPPTPTAPPPADPAGPSPGPSGAPAPTEAPAGSAEAPISAPEAGGGGPLCGTAPPPCSGAKPPAMTTIQSLLDSAQGGPAVVEGALAEGAERCTRSVPPSCASSLFLTASTPRPQGKPLTAKIELGSGHSCRRPAQGRPCCTLAVGSRYRVEGAHEVKQSRWGVEHRLEVTTICALP